MKMLLFFYSWESIFDYYTINISIIYFNRSHYSCLDYNTGVGFTSDVGKLLCFGYISLVLRRID